MKTCIAILSSIILLASCTLQQTYDFNDDFGGKCTTVLDMSAMIELAGEEAGEDAGLGELNLDSLSLVMNMNPGISNSTCTVDNGRYEVAYDFDNLDAINNMESEQGSNPLFEAGGVAMTGETPFVLSGKKFTFTMPDFSEELKKEYGGEDMEDMEGMEGMFNYEIVFKFPRQIKKIDNDNYVISSNGKEATLSTDIGNLMSGDVPVSMTVRFK